MTPNAAAPAPPPTRLSPDGAAPLHATDLRTTADFRTLAARIGEQVAAPAAPDVDRNARFPHEAIGALRDARLLGMMVPREFGGLGRPMSDVAAVCEVLGEWCANAAMVFAMHQIQVACIVRHGTGEPFFRQYLREIAAKQLLLASATTEVNVGGDVRTSHCAVEAGADGAFRLEKQAPVISYGEQADDILVTARRTPDSPSNDQVIVLARGGATRLEPTTTWDTLGFRGTCSLGYRLTTTGCTEQVVPEPYADISARTMLPTSHTLWASLWLGIANAAVDRASAFVRAEARKKPGVTPPGALRLAELVVAHQSMRATVHDAVGEFERRSGDADALSSVGFAIRMNTTKVAASQLLIRIVGEAMHICGISGYREDTKYSLGRHLRDAYGTGIMINNDRIFGASATMLLVHKDDSRGRA